ncbi:MAG: hypothetical protein NVS3B12_34080 [Acidimicrobiales bacterium]
MGYASFADDNGTFAALAEFVSTTEPALRERYDLATDLDAQRHRLWMGEPVQPTRHDGDYALFSTMAAGAAAMVDREISRVFVRRIGLLDSTAVLDRDLAIQHRIEQILAQLSTSPRPASGPPRDELMTAAARQALDFPSGSEPALQR